MSEAALNQSIQRILSKRAIGDQAELLALLANEGHELTQSTLSRHLKKQGYEKRDGHYQRRNDALPRWRGSAVLIGQNLLVIKVDPGFAHALAVTLDREPLPGQAGTIAGDDTIFVAIADGKAKAAFKLAQLMLET
jgi:transcriptional regulator of arginine metabolism